MRRATYWLRPKIRDMKEGKIILEVDALTKRFGGLEAIKDVSFKVSEGEILSIIGPNGAGKSTLFKLITSFLRPSEGSIKFNGKSITQYPAHKVAQLGIVRTFQETTVFREMSVLDNVIVAHQIRSKSGVIGQFWNSRRAREDEQRFKESALDILKHLDLLDIKDELAKNLPHGHLRALSIAVGLAVKPKILLLDEPFAGLNSDETAKAVEMVRAVRDQGITIMLVEHDMKAVMTISERIIVINFGQKIADGLPKEIQKNQDVIDAYLGVEEDD